jgi:hypothetical protein
MFNNIDPRSNGLVGSQLFKLQKVFLVCEQPRQVYA